MMKPPSLLDGAEVRYWAWSESPPFFDMPNGDTGIPIHGLAVCQYPNGAVYRFSCNAAWEVENDSPHDSIAGALGAPSAQYQIDQVVWHESDR